jgi:predicted DNA-binding protein YlxM (UPF0122 family)
MKKDNELFKTLYLKGVRLKEIARIIGIEEASVSKRIWRQKLANRHIEFTNEMVEEMVTHWRDKLSLGQIAIKMDLDKRQVQYQLKKLCLVD